MAHRRMLASGERPSSRARPLSLADHANYNTGRNLDDNEDDVDDADRVIYGLREDEQADSSLYASIPHARVLDKERRRLVRFLDSVPLQSLLLLLIFGDLTLTVYQVPCSITAPPLFACRVPCLACRGALLLRHKKRPRN